MFDFADIFNQGQEFEAHGEKWVVVKTMYKDFVLAIKKNEKGKIDMPAQVFVVKKEK